MANVVTGIICIHSNTESKIEWLKEVFSQSIGIDPEHPYQATELTYVAQFFDLSFGTGYRNNLYSVSEVKKVDNGEFAIYLGTENAWNVDACFWDKMASKLSFEYACKQDIDCEWYINGDSEYNYFPHTCGYDSWSEVESEEFLSENELVGYLKNNYPIGSHLCKDDLEEWDNYLRENNFGAVRIFERE